MFPSGFLLNDTLFLLLFGKRFQVPYGSRYEKVRAPTLVASLTSCAERWRLNQIFVLLNL